MILKSIALFTFLVLIVSIVQVSAQNAVDTTGKIQVKEGTEVQLKLADDLSSKTATVGDKVNLLLAEDLKVGDKIVAKTGAKAVGIISVAKKSGSFGRGGDLNFRLEYVNTGETRIPLRASLGKVGDSKLVTTATITILLGPVGFLKHGKNAGFEAGTPIKAYVDENTWVAPYQSEKIVTN